MRGKYRSSFHLESLYRLFDTTITLFNEIECKDSVKRSLFFSKITKKVKFDL